MVSKENEEKGKPTYQINYEMYFQLAKDDSIQINEFLQNCIRNYELKGYINEKISATRFEKMVHDFANLKLKEILHYKAVIHYDTTEGENLSQFITYLRKFVDDIYKLALNKMQKFDGKASFQEYIEQFYQQIMIKKKCSDMESLKKELEKKYDYEYFILFDLHWRESFKELVKEFQGIKNVEQKEIKMEIKVTFKSKEARNMFNKLCARSISKFRLTEQKDEEAISQSVEFENKKRQALKTIFANFVIFRHTNVQKQFFKSQQQNLLNLNLFTPEVSNQDDNNLMTYQQNPYVLLPQNMNIQLVNLKNNSHFLVQAMKYVINNNDFDFIQYEENEEFDSQSENQDQAKFKKLEYFMTYFYYYVEEDGEEQQSRYAFVPAQVLDDGVKSMQQSCFGLDGFLQNNQMKSLLEEFKNPLRFYECKGPLIYGPPGTGKTFIIQRMIKNFQIHLIFDGNSSTFQTSLQGQGSRLLSNYFNRARAIPWQPCAAHIGEIEQLVKKKDKDGGGGSSEVLNKLLELTDGTETVGNVKIFSTTNHVEMIEEAILSRFRQVYLGKSNTPLRRDWIVWYLFQNKNQSEDDFKSIIKGFVSDVEVFMQQSQQEQENQLRNSIQDIVSYTVNFSTRQLKALMSNITSKILFGELTYQSLPEQKLKFILDFCKSLGEDNFMFGNKSLPRIMFDCLNKKPSQFVNQLLTDQPPKNDYQYKFMDFSAEELNDQEVLQFNDDNYEYSKVIFIDQSAQQNERISILKQKQRISQKIHLYQKVEDMYIQLEVLVGTLLKFKQFESYILKIKESNKKFKTFFTNPNLQPQISKYYKKIKEEELLIPQKIFKFLKEVSQKEKQMLDQKKQEASIQNNSKQEKDEFLETLRGIIKLCKEFEQLIQEIDKLIKEVRDDVANYKNLQSLEQKLIKIKEMLLKDNTEIDSSNMMKAYYEFANSQANHFLKQFRKIIRDDQLELMEVEQIIKQKKFFEINFCSLCDSNYDHIMVLLAEFINRGDFSKVDMVDYHSCERNSAFKDTNSFKDYISNLTKEGKEEEKSLIVYKLDEILNVGETEDQEIENDKKQMAIKIFQSINIDTENSNMWSIFISKNQNVIDLFYNTVTYWPKSSTKGKLNKIQQEQLKLQECKFCGQKFKQCDDEDKCKAHISKEFLIEKNIEKYKKFEGDWYEKYMDEYYKRQKHVNEHKNVYLNKNQPQQDKFTQKNCTYCENSQEFIKENYSQDLYELNVNSFNIMKSNSIIPPFIKSFQQIMDLKQPILFEEVQKRIQGKEALPNEFKRICCQGDYYKEECNPHNHQIKKEFTEECIKQETHNYIKEKLKELK
ncbi:hypothetical protein ABPG72_017515 [Tetrahymena utriculariae]